MFIETWRLLGNSKGGMRHLIFKGGRLAASKTMDVLNVELFVLIHVFEVNAQKGVDFSFAQLCCT